MAEDFEIPEDLYYTEGDVWAKVEDDLVKVGITDFAQDQLGEIVFVESPETGQEVEQVVTEGDEEIGVAEIESVKTVSAIQSPVSGTVKEVNEELEDEPEIINSEPYGAGWLFVVDPSNLEEDLKNLMDLEDYEESVASRD